jgi:hypothetical protein
MVSILPTPPLLLSGTVRGFVCVAIAQPLAASSSSVAPAFVLAHRAHTPSRFTVGTPSFALIRSCFSLCAPLFALGRACFSRCLPLVRLVSRVLYAPLSVAWHQSCYGCRGINPSFSGRSNPPLNLAPFSRWTLRDKAAQRRLALLQGLPQIRKCA